MIDKLKQTFKQLSDPEDPKFLIYKRNLLIMPGGFFLIVLFITYQFIGIPSNANASTVNPGIGGMNTAMPEAKVEGVASTKDKAIELTSETPFQLPSDTGVNLADVKKHEPDSNKEVDYNTDAKDNIDSALNQFNTPVAPSSQFKAEDEQMKAYQKEAESNIAAKSEPEKAITASPVDTTPTKPAPQQSSVFHSLNLASNSSSANNTSNVLSFPDIEIPAAILKKVKVKNEQTVAIRILKTTVIQGVTIKRNSIMRGIVSIGGSRVKIIIPGANIDGKLSKAQFSVFDNAGIEGLEVSGLDKLETGQEVKDEALSTNVPTDNFGVLNGVTNVVRALGSRRSPMIYLPDGKIILKYIGK